jgi:hypothetical protein
MVAELGRGSDGAHVEGILLDPAVEWLAALEHPRSNTGQTLVR